MNFPPIPAWFYWDPPIEAFTIPFLGHPVVWYGIFFVSGFIAAYFILNPIFSRYLRQTNRLSLLSITDWPSIARTFRSSSDPFIFRFMQDIDAKLRQELTAESYTLSVESQQKMISMFNFFLQNGSITLNGLRKLFGKSIATSQETAFVLTDSLCWFAVLGTIIGARLGAVFFYDWEYFRDNPMEILKVWHGGLASHGGTIGIIIGLYFYLKYIQRWIPDLTFLRLLDFVSIPSALAACFIRLGNFMNQEILGTHSTMPWSVIFGHPADGSFPSPRHPVQLYEAVAYASIFLLLFQLWRTQDRRARPGFLVGMLFLLVFSSRFILEFWKASQGSFLTFASLQTGQILSVPFIILGGFLLWRSKGTVSSSGESSDSKKISV